MSAREAILITPYGGLVLAKILPERVLDAPVIAAISTQLMAQLDLYPRPSIAIDMSEVGYISSAMVGKLVALCKGVKAQKGRLAVCGVRPSLMPIFQMVQLDRLVPFHADAERVLLEWRRKPL